MYIDYDDEHEMSQCGMNRFVKCNKASENEGISEMELPAKMLAI
jgi:hypothetical protein